ncbi:MAG: hypothetical protein WBD47_03740 [Phormidesmis sp.]
MASLQKQSNNRLVNARSGGQIQPVGAAQHFSKPLLHILDHDEMPGDMIKKPMQAALRGQRDVYITRAELELKRAMQSLTFTMRSTVNSISTLTALSLPDIAAPLFWTINALLQEKYEKPNDSSRIQHRNHDARLMFQQLAKLNLTPWSHHLVNYVRADALPNYFLFPLGHPILGRTYRRHPFRTRQNHYYPVTDYFSLLFKEREQALLSLLGQLGATKITMTPIPIASQLDCKASLTTQLHQKIFEYPKQIDFLPRQIDVQRHPWLAGEPTWQSVIRERLSRNARSAQFNFDRDVMGMLKAQTKMIGRLIPAMDSMVLPEDHEEEMMTQVLKTQRVQVEFCDVER